VPSPPPKPTSPDATAAWLRERFALRAVRPGQPDVVLSLLHGRRILFVAPTGHGKSLCYQALAASPWSRGVVLVFQPLKALMQEQVTRAESVGLRAALINSDLEVDGQRDVLERAVAKQLDVVFLSPERQGNQLWLDYVARLEIKGVVIDEAHCISQWGHDFRPWYRRLVETIMGIGVRTPVLALTATAPDAVVGDIRGQIGPDDAPVDVVRLPSFRANLRLGCIAVDGLTARLGTSLSLARRYEGAGIVYLLTQDETEIAATFLGRNGVPAAAYHGGMTAETRANSLAQWYGGQVRVVCATSALGMGIDRADVRFVIHAGLPDSLLRYVQEIGRAGRDGAAADIVAIDDPQAKPIYEAFARGSHPAPADHDAIANALRRGECTRGDLIQTTDVPQAPAQRILDDFVDRGLCTRDGSPSRYRWCGAEASGVPPGLQEAIENRRRLTREALAYTEVEGCRASLLARAMGDEVDPVACGHCDACLPQAWAPPDDLIDLAREHLAAYCPPIRAVKWSHADGVCLSRYGLGPIGEAVKAAKYHGASLPPRVLDLAHARVAAPTGPFAGIRIDAVVAIPSMTSTVVHDFAHALASLLGVPCIELTKVRSTAPQKQFRARENKRLNIEGAFDRVKLGAAQHVLLVDDILDSGESLRAAAGAVKPVTAHPLVLARAKHQDDE
jgi:ATP-dependent DNA helicase RecQ